jgi:phosphatidylglycerophosphate synthase
VTESSGSDPAGWSQLHGGIDPARVPFLRGWLRFVGAVAAPLARAGVDPDALTATGVVAAGLAVWATPDQAGLAVDCVLLSAVADGLDGAVAVARNRASTRGAAHDHIADRVADTAFALVLWRAGAPGWLALAAAGLSAAVELRRRQIVLTVAERPTRIVCTVLGLGCVAVGAPGWTVTACAGTWVALASVALVQRWHATSSSRTLSRVAKPDR